jgi:hypothetical protein
MGISPSFLLSVTKESSQTQPETPEMLIIIRRRYAHLEKELIQTFSGKKGVRVLVDRRQGERRREKRPFSHERRNSDRRKPKEELLKVILPT